MAELRSRLRRIDSCNRHMKTAFHQLQSQIKIGLLQAEDVFVSLAIPLMKLVGLKTVEMADEGRFTSLVFDSDSRAWQRNGVNSYGSPKMLPTVVDERDEAYHNRRLKEESFATEVAVTGNELRTKQQQQLIDLVGLLRQIETKVNCCQNDIFQTIADHKVSLRNFFKKAILYLANTDNQNHDTFTITLKLLQVAFSKVGVILDSVEGSVEELINVLAKHMCNPMVKYVKDLKADMEDGLVVQLMAMVEEMGRAMRNGRLELEETRNKVIVAEEKKFEALSRLRETEERIERMKEYLGWLSEAKKGSLKSKSFVTHKFLGEEEKQVKNGNQVWELLQKQRKHQIQESPSGPQELLFSQPNNKCRKSTRVRPSIDHKPVIRFSPRLNAQTPCFDTLIPLGSSPSTAVQQVVSRRRIMR